MQARILPKCFPGFVLALAAVLCVGAAPAPAATGPMFDGLVLVDEINCGDPADPHQFTESGGTSQIQTILGQPCRVMPPGGSARYFAYRIGQGMGLQAGKAYILTVDYPEDQPRAIFITNAGCETTEGIYSGNTVGDAISPPYVTPNDESLMLPLSGQYETWQQLFHLHDRFYRTRETGGRGDEPDDGFMVVIAQFEQADDPTSAGAAVSRIALYEAPDLATYTQPLNLPPEGLPRRALFWREEMSDGVLSGSGAGVIVDTDWFEYKARLHKFLGMNCFSKDLLEFGHNQGWDCTPYGIDPADLPAGEPTWKIGSSWYNTSSTPNRWPNMVAMLENYDLDVMPFYEYAGSIGQFKGSEIPGAAIGIERRCRPLGDTNGSNNYTHITWSEKANCDVTDPDFLEDVRKLLELTIVNHKDQVHFLGAWMRTRPSFWPLSFSDATMARFAAEANGGVPVTRPELLADEMLYEDYIAWWNLKRRAFLEYIRDYLRGEGIDDAIALFTWDTSEGGKNRLWENPNVVTDDPGTWSSLVGSYMTLDDAIADHHQYEMMIQPSISWDYWEWYHANPAPDPWNYQGSEGVLLTHTYTKGYSVADPYSLEMFRTSGGLAIIRHYLLNENVMPDSLVGYFVSDVNRTGPYTMLGEAWAMAYGDPRYIGYLASSSYNRGFPQYVRNFNAAFLALPALPSVVLDGAADNPNVVVRAIDLGQMGTYVSVVNVGYYDAEDVTITLPFPGRVANLVTGQSLPVNGRQVTVSLYPCQLMALGLEVNLPPTASDQTVELRQDGDVDVTLAASDLWTPSENLTYTLISNPAHGTLAMVGNVATYTPDPGFHGTDSFTFTVTDDHSWYPLTSAPAVVTLNVIPNGTPVAYEQAVELLENEQAIVTLIGTDDETPADNLVYTITRQPDHGAVVLLGKLATYMPDADYSGPDSFEFTVTDDAIVPLTSAPATVSLTVTWQKNFGTRAESPEELPVYIFIRGPGTGTIIREGEPLPGDPDILRVILNGTTTASTLVVQGRDNLSIGQIVVNGSLGGIEARTTDVWGDIDVSGGTVSGRINLRNMVDGTLIVGAAGGPRDAMDLSFECVTNYSIASAVPIRSLSCYGWIDDDGTDDAITAPWLGRLTTRTRAANPRLARTACSGDFQADLILTGTGQVPRAGAFGMGNIAGDLSEAVWQVTGGFGRLTVRQEMNAARILSVGDVANVTLGSMRDSDIYAGVAAGVTGLPNVWTDIYTPSSPGGTAARIGGVTVRGMKLPGGWYVHNFVNSNIAAYELGNVQLCNADPDGETPFGVAGYVARRIRYSDRERAGNWNWPARSGETPACGTPLTVNLAVTGVGSFARQEQVARDRAGDGNYAFSDMTGLYCRTLGNWVYLGIPTNQTIDQAGAGELTFQVCLDTLGNYPTLVNSEASQDEFIVNYDRDADAVTVYNSVWSVIASDGAYGIVTPEGVVIAIPLETFGAYDHVKATQAEIWQDWSNTDANRLMDACR